MTESINEQAANAENMRTTGSCLCGTVAFEIHGSLGQIQLCHCSQCRKAQGGAFAANIPVQYEKIMWKGGFAPKLGVYESSPGKTRHWCMHCASPIYSKKSDAPGIVRIRAGLLDEPVSTTVKCHFFVDSKCSWFELTDDLPKYKERIGGDLL
jgi:hypothetical protein